MLDTAEGPAKGRLIAEACLQCNLCQSIIGPQKQVLGELDPKLD